MDCSRRGICTNVKGVTSGYSFDRFIFPSVAFSFTGDATSHGSDLNSHHEEATASLVASLFINVKIDIWKLLE